jgi:hypothetical protein
MLMIMTASLLGALEALLWVLAAFGALVVVALAMCVGAFAWACWQEWRDR